MKICFYIDKESGLPHIYRHEVQEDEVEDVLRKPGEDRPGKENSRIAIGQTRGGRYLELSRLRRNFFDRINTINKIFLFSLYPEHPVYPV